MIDKIEKHYYGKKRELAYSLIKSIKENPNFSARDHSKEVNKGFFKKICKTAFYRMVREFRLLELIRSEKRGLETFYELLDKNE